jgi:hypothetical protein
MLKMFLQKGTGGFLLYGGKTVSAVQTALGFESPGRELTPLEMAELAKIFRDSLDLAPIRIKLGKIGVFGLGGAPFTHGNTIYVPVGGWLAAGSDTVPDHLLAHEATHVWQFQNGGSDYMTLSLVNQFHGWYSSGDRGAAYNFEAGIKGGKTWAQLNPEQQAALIEYAYIFGMFDDEAKLFEWNGADYTEFARKAIEHLRNGEGAP